MASILNVWYPGTEGGNATADLLFGDASPSAKLPVSSPRSVGQVPMFYSSPALHHKVLEPGTFDVWIGNDSNATLHNTFTLRP